MEPAAKAVERKILLSTIWLFAVLNYLYCDVVSLMDSRLLGQYLSGTVNGMAITQGFLLGAGFLVEIPMAMVVLSRVLKHRANRAANVVAGIVMTLVQVATLIVGRPAPYYVFFSVVKLASSALVVWLAWRWREGEADRPALHA
jgi:hypothetical protein